MQTIAILGFFSLVVSFFFIGREDFGLKPDSKNISNNKNMKVEEELQLEEVND